MKKKILEKTNTGVTPPTYPFFVSFHFLLKPQSKIDLITSSLFQQRSCNLLFAMTVVGNWMRLGKENKNLMNTEYHQLESTSGNIWQFGIMICYVFKSLKWYIFWKCQNAHDDVLNIQFRIIILMLICQKAININLHQ